MSVIVHTAARAGLLSCHACDLLVGHESFKGESHPVCPRCGTSMHQRKPDSLNRTWALLIAAAILYIPANVYPIMTVISFGKGAPDTILSGVIHLIEADQFPIAALVFFASIAVPVLKLFGLSYLLLSVHFKSMWRPRDRTVLYRVIEAVGRWSMIDIFMISILVALVKLGSIATIEPGAGATSFAAVVILTMFSSMSFDPRLMWDAMEDIDG
jgi:paraquat-inducible protein A